MKKKKIVEINIRLYKYYPTDESHMRSHAKISSDFFCQSYSNFVLKLKLS